MFKWNKIYIPNYKPSQHLLLQQNFTAHSEFSKIDTFKSPSKDEEKPDGYDLVHQIRECTKLGLYSHGQRLHCYVLRSGFTSNLFVSSSLVNFYVKFDLVKDAQKVFDEMPESGLVAWNSLISGYVQSGKFRKALSLFLQLERSNLGSDSYSFTAALAACGQLSLVHLGQSVHSKIVKVGVECSTFVTNCLIDTYGKLGHVEDAIELFNNMTIKDTFSWNSVIAASTRNQRIEQAFGFLRRMPDPDTISYNLLINGVAQFGNIDHAVEILSATPNPNPSSFNSIVTACVNRNRPRTALEFFREMHSHDVRTDQYTFSSVLSGAARLGALTWGVLVHCRVVKSGLNESVVVGSALIDMYAKCGRIVTSESLFESLPDKNLVTWNAMMSGYAHNEDSARVVELFERMKSSTGLRPDGVTFLNVLSSCWHGGASVAVVGRYLESMVGDYGIEPTAEHCGCVIRVMGRRGEVWRAEGVIRRLGLEGCAAVWRAVVAACGDCGDLRVAERAAKKVVELEGDSEFVYVAMSSLYARYGRWEDAGETRKVMREKMVVKEPGYSWVEIQEA